MLVGCVVLDFVSFKEVIPCTFVSKSSALQARISFLCKPGLSSMWGTPARSVVIENK